MSCRTGTQEILDFKQHKGRETPNCQDSVYLSNGCLRIVKSCTASQKCGSAPLPKFHLPNPLTSLPLTLYNRKAPASGTFPSDPSYLPVRACGRYGKGQTGPDIF